MKKQTGQTPRRKPSISLDETEYEILAAYAHAKGYRSIGSFALVAMEQAMGRSKVRDLHERLQAHRMGEHGGLLGAARHEKNNPAH